MDELELMLTEPDAPGSPALVPGVMGGGTCRFGPAGGIGKPGEVGSDCGMEPIPGIWSVDDSLDTGCRNGMEKLVEAALGEELTLSWALRRAKLILRSRFVCSSAPSKSLSAAPARAGTGSTPMSGTPGLIAVATSASSAASASKGGLPANEVSPMSLAISRATYSSSSLLGARESFSEASSSPVAAPPFSSASSPPGGPGVGCRPSRKALAISAAFHFAYLIFSTI